MCWFSTFIGVLLVLAPFVNAIHYTKGEGIEKKVDEVAAQVAGAAK